MSWTRGWRRARLNERTRMSIKAKGPQLVNSARTWLITLAGISCLVLGAANAWAAVDAELDEPALPTPEPTVPSPASTLPEIEARDFSVKVVQRSKSAKIYLFDDLSDAKTRAGKILLLRQESNLIMAFRVLKTYPDKKQFAAKRVRRYGEVQVLEPQAAYMALEKVGDVVIPPPTAQDKADLKELEAGPNASVSSDAAPPPTADSTSNPPPLAPIPEVQAYDTDLDAATTPPPAGAADSENSGAKKSGEEEEDALAHLGAAIDEVNSIDTNRQWLTAGIGYLRNNTVSGSPAYYAGLGLRYGLTLGKMLFLRRAHVQDSVAAEAGAFYYKILNYNNQEGNAYEVLPLIGTFRYNILFSENFGIFFYAGIVQNMVTSVAGGTEAEQAQYKSALHSTFPAAGGGLLFRVGPNWDARVDLGIDQATLGLVLRF